MIVYNINEKCDLEVSNGIFQAAALRSAYREGPGSPAYKRNSKFIFGQADTAHHGIVIGGILPEYLMCQNGK